VISKKETVKMKKVMTADAKTKRKKNIKHFPGKSTDFK
jgi:hypothetical protein